MKIIEKIEIQRAITNAQPNIKNAFFSEEVDGQLFGLYSQQNINKEDASVIGYNSGLYTLGLLTEEEFIGNISGKIKTQNINIIVGEIRNKIIPFIKEKISSYSPLKEEGESETEENKDEETPSTLETEPEHTEEDINRDELLKAIEDPETEAPLPMVVPQQPSGNPAADRLKGIVMTPKETKQVVAEIPKPIQPANQSSQPKPNISQSIPQKPSTSIPKYSGSDPYREPLA